MPFKSLRSNSRDTNGPGYNSAQIGATLVALPTYFVAFIRRDYSFCGDFATVSSLTRCFLPGSVEACEEQSRHDEEAHEAP